MAINREWLDRFAVNGMHPVGQAVELVKPPRNFRDEKDFQWEVIKEARDLGWEEYHTYNSRRSKKGFPDLVLVRERVIFAELKTEDEDLTADQRNWREWLEGAQAEYYLWRPSDWPKIAETLRTTRPPRLKVVPSSGTCRDADGP